MKMKKRGTFSEIGGWALGLVIVLVVIFVLLGPKKLLSETKDAIFSFGAGLLPEEKPPQFSSIERISPELGKYFDNLVLKIKNSGKGRICTVEIGQPSIPKNFQIVLYQYKIELKKKSERGFSPPEKSEAVEGFKPCSIKGEKASRFYDCFKAGISCTDAYESGNIIIDDYSKIAPYLFKFDNAHLCAIYLDGIDLNPRCSKVKGLIDNACVDEIRRTYPECSKALPPKPQFDECGAINYCYDKLQIKNARPDLPCTPSTPTAFFYTTEDCIKGSRCIKEHSDITRKDCDESNKDLDIWSWPKYFQG